MNDTKQGSAGNKIIHQNGVVMQCRVEWLAIELQYIVCELFVNVNMANSYPDHLSLSGRLGYKYISWRSFMCPCRGVKWNLDVLVPQPKHWSVQMWIFMMLRRNNELCVVSFFHRWWILLGKCSEKLFILWLWYLCKLNLSKLVCYSQRVS
jgi:hypothetical protein